MKNKITLTAVVLMSTAAVFAADDMRVQITIEAPLQPGAAPESFSGKVQTPNGNHWRKLIVGSPCSPPSMNQPDATDNQGNDSFGDDIDATGFPSFLDDHENFDSTGTTPGTPMLQITQKTPSPEKPSTPKPTPPRHTPPPRRTPSPAPGPGPEGEINYPVAKKRKGDAYYNRGPWQPMSTWYGARKKRKNNFNGCDNDLPDQNNFSESSQRKLTMVISYTARSAANAPRAQAAAQAPGALASNMNKVPAIQYNGKGE